MKVIDLLNKIANGEEVPKKIKYYKNIYEYNQNDKRYYNVEPKKLDLSSKFGDYNFNYLNDGVEIIEEKEIEKLEYKSTNSHIEDTKEIINKINELIDEINKLKRNINDSNV